MNNLRMEMRERAAHTRAYLRMLLFIERHQASLVGYDGKDSFHIGVDLSHTMKATVFLHLYNLVESTVNACLRRIGESIKDDCLSYNRISQPWREAWVKSVIKGDLPLNPQTRLEHVLKLCNHIVDDLVVDFTPQNNSGNLDDKVIETVAGTYGVRLLIRENVNGSIKRFVLNKKGAMEVVREARNNLAHGLISFSDCGKDWTTQDLRRWTIIVILYLEDVIDSFDAHLLGKEYVFPLYDLA